MLVVDPVIPIAPNVSFLQYTNNEFQFIVQPNVNQSQIELGNLFAVNYTNATYIYQLKTEATNDLNNLVNVQSQSLQQRLQQFRQSLPADPTQLGIFIKASNVASSGVLSCYLSGELNGFPVDTNGRYDYLTDQIMLEKLTSGTYNFLVQAWNGQQNQTFSVVGNAQLWTVLVRSYIVLLNKKNMSAQKKMHAKTFCYKIGYH